MRYQDRKLRQIIKLFQLMEHFLLMLISFNIR